jgi:hypothetical protein
MIRDRLQQLRHPIRNQGGYILLLAIIMSIALFIALGGVISLGLASLTSAKRSMFDLSAMYVAEAGVDNAVNQINANVAYTGTNTTCPLGTTGENPVTLFSNTTQGKGTYEDCVTAGSISHELIVYAEGKVYRNVNDTSPYSVRKIKVVVEGSPAGQYAVQTGPGGLIMSNSATIVNGPISIGGYLSMSNTATIGSSSSPLTVNVANDRCPSPADGTYPQVCASGVQPNPVTLSSPNNHIYGTVNANGQTNAYSTQMTGPGLSQTSGVTPPSLPTYNRSAQKTAVTSTETGDISCTGSTNLTWPANYKIAGNVSLGNNCVVKVSGNVWITGSFTMTQKANIQTATGVSTQPVIMVDGAGGVSTANQTTITANSNNIGLEFITFYCGSSCSPDSTVTGAGLAASQLINTITLSNQSTDPYSVFYAYWSEITLGQSTTAGAILGQTINLGNSGNISFDDPVATGTYTYSVAYYTLQ